MFTITENPLRRLPPWASHWLGYRAPPPALPPPSNSQQKVGASPPKPLPQPYVWLWSWIGAFGGLAVLQAVFGKTKYFVERNVPALVPSYGATAVLIYGVIDSPLAQPRNAFFGTFIGALTGVCTAKLFELLPTEERYDELVWLATSIACATTIVLMQITKTVHPPSGAAAIIPILDVKTRALGWYYLPVVLLSSTLAIAVALLTNNVQRRYPVWWIEPPAPAAAPSAGTPPAKGPVQTMDGENSDVSEKQLGSKNEMLVEALGAVDGTGRTTPTVALEGNETQVGV